MMTAHATDALNQPKHNSQTFANTQESGSFQRHFSFVDLVTTCFCHYCFISVEAEPRH